MHPSQEKLSALRKLMFDFKIDVYVIPSTDPHMGEYVPEHWRIIEWLTGFTGSSGTVVILSEQAVLWTDSRYYIQAENQLADSGFILMNQLISGKKDYLEWIFNLLDFGGKLALDGRLFSIDQIRKTEKILAEKKVSFDFECDLVSDLWQNRPAAPLSVAFDHSVEFCGVGRNDKISVVRGHMRSKGADYHLLTSPEDIMWLLNIRGGDIKYSPLLISFALLDESQILLFIEESKMPFRLAMEFDRLGIVMLPYEETAGMLSTLDRNTTIIINPLTTSASLYHALPDGINILEELTIPARLKSIKNKVEIENIKRAMIRDGVALSRFYYWLEQNIGVVELTEVMLGEKLDSLRSENENFLCPSFSTIVAFNKNGALPHYSANIDSDEKILPDGILLIDSGGQYLDGTTDITRTIAIGTPTAAQKKDFTLVLKGMINLANAKFPAGTSGSQLDFLARKALWEAGLNYGHGTGHGVGFCLNVHEGPISISPVGAAGSKYPLEPGNLLSDEPAVYRIEEYGIRIENLILCSEDRTTEFGKFLQFESVSLCYIDKSLIDVKMLDQTETAWLNSYHEEVYNKLNPFLSSEEKKWLRSKTKAL